MKLIQRRIRKHLIDNQNRYLLVSYYLDRVFPAILSHSQIVMNDKGHDLDNMTALDLSRIRFQVRGYKFQVVTEMDSMHYHGFLRKHIGLLKKMTRFFGPSARSYPNINFELIKRQVILDLVFRKRWENVTRLDSFQPVTYHPPVFTLEEVKQFIEGGVDPLEKYLNDMKDMQDQRYTEYMEKLKASKFGRVHRVYTRSETMLLLLNAIKPEDATAVFLRVTEIALQHLLQLRPGSSATANSNMLTNMDDENEENFSGNNSKGEGNNSTLLFGDEDGTPSNFKNTPIRAALPIRSNSERKASMMPLPPKSGAPAPRRSSMMPQQQGLNRSQRVPTKDDGEIRPSQPIDNRKKSVMLMSPRAARIKS